MTYNEFIIKHELRSKLLIEAVQTLYKAIRIKQGTGNSLKQRALILGSLIVIENLINQKSDDGKRSVISEENYINSIRILVIKEF